MPEETLNEASVLFDSSPDSQDSTESTETADSSAETQNTDTAEEGETVEETEVAAETPEATPEENVRFDQHPRFKELHSSNKELKEQLAALSSKFEAQNPQEQTDFDGKFSDLDNKLEEGDITLAEFNQQSRALMQEQTAFERQQATETAQEQSRTRELQNKFLKDHGYLNDLLQSKPDEIESLIADNPLHDQVSAAMELRIKELETGQETAVKEAVEQAVKAKEQEMLKNFKAKQSARSLGEGARSAEPDANALLKDTSQYGGVKNVLAERLKARRTQATS